MATINLNTITPKGEVEQDASDKSDMVLKAPVPKAPAFQQQSRKVQPINPTPAQPAVAEDTRADLENLFVGSDMSGDDLLAEVTAKDADGNLLISEDRIVELAPLAEAMASYGRLAPEQADIIQRVAIQKFWQNEGKNLDRSMSGVGTVARGSVSGIGKFIGSAVDTVSAAVQTLDKQAVKATAKLFGDETPDYKGVDVGSVIKDAAVGMDAEARKATAGLFGDKTPAHTFEIDDKRLAETIAGIPYNNPNSRKLEKLLASSDYEFGEQLGGAYAMGASIGTLNSLKGVQALRTAGYGGKAGYYAIVDGIPAWVNSVNDGSFAGEIAGVEKDSTKGRLIAFAENLVLGAGGDALLSAIGTSVKGRRVKVQTEDTKRKVVSYAKKYLDADFDVREAAYRKGETKEQYLERLGRIGHEADAVRKAAEAEDAERLASAQTRVADSVDEDVATEVAIARDYEKAKAEVETALEHPDVAYEGPIPKRPKDYYKADPSTDIRRAVNDYVGIPQATKQQAAEMRQAEQVSEDLDHLFDDPPAVTSVDVPSTQTTTDRVRIKKEHSPHVDPKTLVRKEQLALPAPKEAPRRAEAKARAEAAAAGARGTEAIAPEITPIEVGAKVAYKGDSYEVTRVGRGRATIRDGKGKPKVVKIDSLDSEATTPASVEVVPEVKGGIRSKKRVRDLGEVMTPPRLVNDMLDKLPSDVFTDMSKTFLEPSVGSGNFVVEILSRKLKNAKTDIERLRGLSSIYGVDIDAANVAETVARMRKQTLDSLDKPEKYAAKVDEILGANIQRGDFLERPSQIVVTEWSQKGLPRKKATSPLDDLENSTPVDPTPRKKDPEVKVEMVPDPEPAAVHKPVPVADDTATAAQSFDQAMEIQRGKQAVDYDQRPAQDKDPAGILPDKEMPIGNIYEKLAESKLQSSVKVGSYVGPTGKLRTITISKPGPDGRIIVSTGEPSAKVRSKLMAQFSKRDTLETILKRLEVEQGVDAPDVIWDPAILPSDAREIVRSMNALGIQHMPDVESVIEVGNKALGRENGSVAERIREAFEDTKIRLKNVERGLYDMYSDAAMSAYSQMRLLHPQTAVAQADALNRVNTVVNSGLENMSRTLDITQADAKKMADDYLLAMRALEVNPRVGDGAAGITTDNAKATVANTPEVVKAEARRLQQMTVQTLDWLVEGGLITSQARDKLIKENANYIPLTRVLEDRSARKVSMEIDDAGRPVVLGSRDSYDVLYARELREVETRRESYVTEMKARRPKATLDSLRREAARKFKNPKRADILRRVRRESRRADMELGAQDPDAGIIEVDPDELSINIQDSFKAIRGSSLKVVSPYETIPAQLAQAVRAAHRNRWAQVLANNVRKDPTTYGMTVVAKPETIQRADAARRKVILEQRKAYAASLIKAGETRATAKEMATVRHPLPTDDELAALLRVEEMRKGELGSGLKEGEPGKVSKVEPAYIKFTEMGVPKYIVAREAYGAHVLESIAKEYHGYTPPNHPAAIVGGMVRDGLLAMRSFQSRLITYMPDFMVNQKIRDVQEVMAKLSTDLNYAAGGHSMGNLSTDVSDMLRVGRYLDLSKTNVDDAAKYLESLDPAVRKDVETALEAREAGALIEDVRFIEANNYRNRLKEELKEIHKNAKALEFRGKAGARRDALTKIEDTVKAGYDWYHMANAALENSSRLRAYKEFRAAGFSKETAALKARDISYDPMKRGYLAPYLSMFNIFANPAIQGTWSSLYNMSRGQSMLKQRDLGAFAVTAGIRGSAIAFSVLAPMVVASKVWNAIMFPEASERVSVYDEAMGANLIVSETDDGRPISLKALVPHNYAPITAVLNSAGDKITGVRRYDGYGKDLRNTALTSALDPLGLTGGIGTFIPDILRPSVEVATNYSFFTGREIARQVNGVDSQSYGKMREEGGLDSFLVSVTDSLSKGGVDVNPKNVRHWVRGTLGGVYELADGIADAVGKAMGSNGKWNASELPVVRGVIRDGISHEEYKLYYESRGTEKEIRQGVLDTERERKQLREAAYKWARAYQAGDKDLAAEHLDSVADLTRDPKYGAGARKYFEATVRRSLNSQQNGEARALRKLSDPMRRAEAIIDILDSRGMLYENGDMRQEYLDALNVNGVFNKETIIYFNELFRRRLSEAQ